MLRLFWAEATADVVDSDSLPLSEYRRQRLIGLKGEASRRESLWAELLLCRAVKSVRPEATLPLDIRAGEQGKPELKDGGLYFSLSHSDGRVLCAIADAPVGVDIQKQAQGKLKVAKRFFTESEYLSVVGAENSDFAFTRLWCLKESYLKMLGTGLNTPLRSFELRAEVDGTFRAVGNDRYLLRHWELDDYHVAVCFRESLEVTTLERLELSGEGL